MRPNLLYENGRNMVSHGLKNGYRAVYFNGAKRTAVLP